MIDSFTVQNDREAIVRELNRRGINLREFQTVPCGNPNFTTILFEVKEEEQKVAANQKR